MADERDIRSPRPSGTAPPLVSVCLVSAHRPAQLDACLASLAAQSDAPPFEVLVCANGDRGVEALVRRWFADATIALVERANPGAARNVLVHAARGEVLLFIDDDVVVRPDMLARLATVVAAHPERAVFGGPNATPPGSPFFEVVQGAVLASIVATGPVRRRYGAHPPGSGDERHFILCNLAIRREAMLSFPPDLVCAEENAVLAEMHTLGLTMLYDPALVVYHERRPSFRTFARQMYKYGVGRGQLLVRDRQASTPAFLVPSALVAYLAAAPLLVLVDPRLGLAAVAWAAASAAGAVRVGITMRRRRLLATLLSALLIPTVHICYGVGVVRGLFKPPRRVKTPDARWLPRVDAVDET